MMHTLRYWYSSTKIIRRYAPVVLIIALLLFGVLVRAYWLPFHGFSFDTGVNKTWGLSALRFGLVESYTQQIGDNMLPNYPPLSIAIFTYMGMLANMLQVYLPFSPEVLHNIAIKLPANVADAITAFLLTWYLRSRIHRTTAYIIGALYFAHPATIYNSAYWGQTDSIYTMFIVLSIVLMFTKYFSTAGITAACSLLSKMQAIIFFPLFAVNALFYKKALQRSLTWFCIIFLLTLTPFVLFGQIDAVLDVYTKAVGYYSSTSSNAYNLWWVLFNDNQVSDTDRMFGAISYRSVGLLIFTIFYGISAVVLLWQKRTPESKLHAEMVVFAMCAVASVAFFTWTTQMHERYLFPFMALGLPVLIQIPRAIIPYILLSVCYGLNLLGVLPYSALDKALFNQFPGFDILIASTVCASCIWYSCLVWAHYSASTLKNKPLTQAKIPR